ncbi:hypothetical protein [Paraburkholderia sp.]|uniref:hypothetical protein n=1 Tax=Paraburkholderia sp. TaxID=1926495 RepID=UPI00238B389C|nr:hypothetical protein [Paraburkholderia sp.]MDE1184258.1 hypothetical protein [Paraburkholderia sp.]
MQQPTFEYSRPQPISRYLADELRSWVQLWVVEATVAGFIKPPYKIGDDLLERALALYEFGVEPIDAAYSLFGVVH